MNEQVSVLVVEDEAISALILIAKLKNIGFKVYDAVSTGEEAIIAAERYKPDVVLMDITLAAELDGINTAEEIIKRIRTKIIFLTGYQDGNIKKRAMMLNPHAYFVKPVDYSELGKTIKAGIDN